MPKFHSITLSNRLTGSDPSVMDYFLEVPGEVFAVRWHYINEKTLVECTTDFGRYAIFQDAGNMPTRIRFSSLFVPHFKSLSDMQVI